MSAATYVCRQFVEDVTAYLEGTLPDDVAQAVEEHLADCPHCREYLEQMRRTVAVERALGEEEIEEMPAEVRERLTEAFRTTRPS
jgi:anti-sigma factor RsiW